MTNSTYYGATFLLAEDPGADRVAEIANTIADSHFPETPCSHQLSSVLPVGLPVDVADQLLAHQKDLGPTALFLLVAPSRETTRPKAPNVKIPS
jgi:hypothetical protein